MEVFTQEFVFNILNNIFLKNEINIDRYAMYKIKMVITSILIWPKTSIKHISLTSHFNMFYIIMHDVKLPCRMYDLLH